MADPEAQLDLSNEEDSTTIEDVTTTAIDVDMAMQGQPPSNCFSIDARIVSTHNHEYKGDTFTMYRINCSLPNNVQWTVTRRFSEFHDIKTHIEKQRLRTYDEHQFPGKTVFSDKLDAKTVANRLEKLGRFLYHTLSCDKTLRDPRVLVFFRPVRDMKETTTSIQWAKLMKWGEVPFRTIDPYLDGDCLMPALFYEDHNVTEGNESDKELADMEGGVAIDMSSATPASPRGGNANIQLDMPAGTHTHLTHTLVPPLSPRSSCAAELRGTIYRLRQKKKLNIQEQYLLKTCVARLKEQG